MQGAVTQRAGPSPSPSCLSGALLSDSGHQQLWSQGKRHKSPTPGLPACVQVTFGHNLMHGDREEEDGVTVVGP